MLKLKALNFFNFMTIFPIFLGIAKIGIIKIGIAKIGIAKFGIGIVILGISKIWIKCY